jgi:hypothetical protein
MARVILLAEPLRLGLQARITCGMIVTVQSVGTSESSSLTEWTNPLIATPLTVSSFAKPENWARRQVLASIGSLV